MPKKNLKSIISELENAKLQDDGSIKVNMTWGRSISYEGTINYSDFRCFCEELIRKIIKI